MMTVFDVDKDLQSDSNLKRIRRHINNQVTDFIFDPTTFSENNNDYSLEEYRLTDEELLDYARRCTAVRNRITRDSQ